MSATKNKFGVYVHVPFCRARCNYCHFVIRPWRSSTAERYWKAVVREVDMFFDDRRVEGEADSFYFGGGTPSIVPAEHIHAILEACRKHLPLSPDCEISLESNPGSLTSSKIDAYRRMGVTRMSVGAQCFDDHELELIGRDHTAAQIEESVALLRHQGIQNINLDLMLGLPFQTRQSWTRGLDKIAELMPAHLSVYMLDLDSKAPLFHRLAKGRIQLPEDDLTTEAYLITQEFLAPRGYGQYEISNFALPGFRCRHNVKYWLREPVLAFGVGSHSYDGRVRYANHSSMHTYLEAVEGGSTPIEWSRPIQAAEALQEKLFLGLRLNEGLDWTDVSRTFGDELVHGYERYLKELADEGLVAWDDSHVRLTTRGILLSNEIFQNFV